MDVELVKLILDAGIGVVAIMVISGLFIFRDKAHRDERKEWREKQEEQAEKVTEAVRELASGINKLIRK